MRALSSALGPKSLLLLLPLLGACTGWHPGPALVGSTADRDNQVSEGESPHISLLVQPPRPDHLVDAAFQVDAEGYALVVAVDRDQRVRVLFPESPGSEGFVTPRISHMATPFFEGTGRGAFQSGPFDREYYPYRHDFFSSWPDPYRPGLARYQPAVVVVAIVSGQPLELDRLRASSGGWAEGALRDVMLDPAGSYVGERLGQLVSRPGQQFSTDYRVIAGGSASPLYAGTYYRGCAYGGFGADYRGGGYGARMVELEPFTPNGAWVTGVGGDYSRFAVYPLTGACGATYLWDAPGAHVRRPPQLFPGDTTLLFTTRRTAMRLPGGQTIGTPQVFPTEGDQGHGIPDLSRSGPGAAREGDKGASAPAPSRGEARNGNAKPSPAPAPPRRGSRG